MGRLTDRSDISIAVYHGSKAKKKKTKKKKTKKQGTTKNNVLMSFNPVSFGVYSLAYKTRFHLVFRFPA